MHSAPTFHDITSSFATALSSNQGGSFVLLCAVLVLLVAVAWMLRNVLHNYSKRLAECEKRHGAQEEEARDLTVMVGILGGALAGTGTPLPKAYWELLTRKHRLPHVEVVDADLGD